MSRSIILPGLLLALMGFWQGSALAQCVDYGDYLHAASQYPLPGDAVAVALYEGWSQDYLTVANEEFGLRIFDLTDPYRPRLVSTASTFGSVQDMVFDLIFGYLATGPYGVVVVSLVDVENPVQASTLELPGTAYSLEKAGNFLFVASGTEGLHVVDVTQASFPYPLVAAHLPLSGDIRSIKVVGDIAYLCDASGSNGLILIDISDPLAPAVLGAIDVPGTEEDVDVAGGFAYLALTGSGYLKVIDVSDPTAPAEVSAVAVDTSNEGIFVDGATALVANTYYGLRIVDISNPYNPVRGSRVDTPDRATDVIKVNDLVYVADTAGGLQVIAAASLEPPPLLATLDLEGNARGLALSGDICLVAGYGSGLKIVDFADPQAPFVTASYNPGYVRRVAAAGQLAFVAVYDFGLQVLDISDPAQPLEIGNLPSLNPPWHIATADDLVFIAEVGEYLLRVVDVSDPTMPGTIGTHLLEYAEDVNGMLARDGYLYLTSQIFGLKIFDVHDPANLSLVARRTDLQYTRNLWLDGDRLYVSHEEGVKIYDVTDPSLPLPIGSFALTRPAETITTLNNILYATASDAGMRAFDVTRLDDVVAVGGVEHDLYYSHVAVTPEIAICASFSGLMHFAPIHCTTVTAVDDAATAVPGNAVLQVGAHPNPFNPRTTVTFSLPRTGRVRLGIYNLRGQRLTTLTDRDYQAGSHSIFWDGRDDHGQAMASGHYIARVETRGAVATGRLVLVR